MIVDYYRSLTHRAVTKVSDSAGQFTETVIDYTIYGYLAELSGKEVERYKSTGREAECALFTTANLDLKDRIVDGTVEYEVTWKFSNFHVYYLLKRVR